MKKKKAARKKAAKRKAAKKTAGSKILAIDIGGSGLKAAMLSSTGKFLSKRVRVETPPKCKPERIVRMLAELVKPLKGYDRVGAGFPGYVRDGKIVTAPNLGTKLWAGFDLAGALERELGKAVRIANDADVQGLAAVRGNGLELVCTLGTGFGTAWFRDGELMPHMEIAHMAIHKKLDLDQYVGERSRKHLGNSKWNKHVQNLIDVLHTVFQYDRLYLGGGNSRHVKFKLPKNVSLISNRDGIKGGAFLWSQKRSPE